jgi:hypothetical protein
MLDCGNHFIRASCYLFGTEQEKPLTENDFPKCSDDLNTNKIINNRSNVFEQIAGWGDQVNLFCALDNYPT